MLDYGNSERKTEPEVPAMDFENEWIIW